MYSNYQRQLEYEKYLNSYQQYISYYLYLYNQQNQLSYFKTLNYQNQLPYYYQSYNPYYNYNNYNNNLYNYQNYNQLYNQYYNHLYNQNYNYYNPLNQNNISNNQPLTYNNYNYNQQLIPNTQQGYNSYNYYPTNNLHITQNPYITHAQAVDNPPYLQQTQPTINNKPTQLITNLNETPINKDNVIDIDKEDISYYKNLSNKKTNPLLFIIPILSIIIICSLIYFIFFNKSTIDIIDFTNKHKDQLNLWIKDHKIDPSLIIIKEEYNQNIMKDYIISQDKLTGQLKDTPINFIISKGNKLDDQNNPDTSTEIPSIDSKIDMLNFIDQPYLELTNWANTNNYKLQQPQKIYSHLPKDTIIETNPKANEKIDQNTIISSTISSGPILVKNFIKMTKSQFEEWLYNTNIENNASANLKLEIIKQENKNYNNDIILKMQFNSITYSKNTDTEQTLDPNNTITITITNNPNIPTKELKDCKGESEESFKQILLTINPQYKPKKQEAIYSQIYPKDTIALHELTPTDSTKTEIQYSLSLGPYIPDLMKFEGKKLEAINNEISKAIRLKANNQWKFIDLKEKVSEEVPPGFYHSCTTNLQEYTVSCYNNP